MKYLIDLSSSQPQGGAKVNGGGEYAVIIFKEMLKAIDSNDELSVIFNSDLEDNDRVNRFVKEADITTYYYDTISTFNKVIEKEQFDCIVLPVCYYKYCDLHVNDSVHLITIIHDLCDIHFSEIKVKYGRYIVEDGRDWLRKIRDQIRGVKKRKQYITAHNRVIHLNKNQTIVTVSNYTANEFSRYLDIESKDKIKIFYTPEVHRNIVLENIEKESEVLKKYNISPKKYFLLCAGARWTKNNAIALFSLDDLFSQRKYNSLLEEYKVIIIGTDSVNGEYYKRHIRNIDRFIIDDYVDDYTIETLYKNTHLFLFPSVLEGFGLPPIEAMKYNSISACSDTMSIPEICGDAVIYFNPYNKKSIKKAIIKSFDKQYTSELKGIVQRRFDYLHNKREKDLKALIELIIQGKNGI